MTNKVQIPTWAHDYGEDYDFVRVKGEFPCAGTMQFIDSERVEAGMARGQGSDRPAHPKTM